MALVDYIEWGHFESNQEGTTRGCGEVKSPKIMGSATRRAAFAAVAFFYSVGNISTSLPLEFQTDNEGENLFVTNQNHTTIRRPFSPSSFEQTLADRGLNLITTASGCHLAAWVFQAGEPQFIDCYLPGGHGMFPPSEESIYNASQHLDGGTVPMIQPYDTIYVNIEGLAIFIDTILPNISTPIVLLAGQWQRCKKLAKEKEEVLLASPYIVKLFIHSVNYHLHDWRNPKVAPWAYGISHARYSPSDPDHLEPYRRAFWMYLHANKTRGIMHGYLNRFSNRRRRKKVPSSPKKLTPTEYYDEMAQHQFILSPNGDRPECYRHYEAIGLGTVPITQLSLLTHPHFQPGPILYGTTDWNLTAEQALERLGTSRFPAVNRLMILEEYWIGYVQGIVGRSDLRWFDRIARQHAKFEDFQVLQERPTMTANNDTVDA
jgi:hypothetical protein